MKRNRCKHALISSLLLLLLPLLLACAAKAQIDSGLQEMLQEQMESLGADNLAQDLPDETQDLLDELELSGPDIGRLLSLSPQDFFKLLAALATKAVRAPLRALGAITGVVVLCALVGTLKSGMQSSAVSSVFSTISLLCVITAVAKPITECILDTAGALKGCGTFMLSFIPAFTTIITVSGAPVTATTYNLLLFTACQLISSLASNVLIPFMGIYMGLCIAGGMGEDIGVLPLAKGVRSFVTWCLTLSMTVYVGLLSMQTLVSTGADSVMMKTGKFLIGSFVPIVGGAISDALSAAQGAVHLLKTTVGAFGIVCGALTFLPVLLRVLLWYFALKCASFVSNVLAMKKLGGLLGACSDCMGTLIALLFSFMLLIIISIVLLLSFSSGG